MVAATVSSGGKEVGVGGLYTHIQILDINSIPWIADRNFDILSLRSIRCSLFWSSVSLSLLSFASVSVLSHSFSSILDIRMCDERGWRKGSGDFQELQSFDSSPPEIENIYVRVCIYDDYLGIYQGRHEQLPCSQIAKN